MGGIFNVFANDMGNYEDRKVGRDDVGGVTVSTAYCSDLGYETAILDQNDAYPVERYGGDKSAAIRGHAKWVTAAPSLITVDKLGYDDFGIETIKVLLSRSGN